MSGGTDYECENETNQFTYLGPVTSSNSPKKNWSPVLFCHSSRKGSPNPKDERYLLLLVSTT